MMSPEMMRAAADMMGNMRPEDLEAISRQMQNLPPEQMQRMMGAAGGAPPGMPNPADMMRNMKPEDLQFMARQMQSIPPEQMQRMMAQMGGGPSGGAAGGFPGAANVAGAAPMLQQRQKYELDAATRLKEEGNKLHGAGNFERAADKYIRARDNLSGHSSSQAAAVRKACSLNLMSCNLKLGKYSEAVKIGDEVLAKDTHNLKALYRRGQAHLKLGHAQCAVSDLKEAAALSPDDETLAGVLREAESELQKKKELGLSGDGAKEEEEVEEIKGGRSKDKEESKVTTVGGVTIEDVTEEDSRPAGQGNNAAGAPASSASSSGAPGPVGPGDVDALRHLEMLKTVPPEQVAALSGGSITPEMATMAAKMVSTMSPEELKRMMDLAQRFGPAAAGSAGPGMPFSMPPAASSGAATPAGTSAARDAGSSAQDSTLPSNAGAGGFDTGRAGPGPSPFGANPLENPEMVKTMSEMMKNMSAEDLAAMSKQMGMPMTVEQAKQTKELMDKVGPQNLATMMKWSNKAQGLWLHTKEGLHWLLRHPAILIAIIVVVVAVLGRLLGYF